MGEGDEQEEEPVCYSLRQQRARTHNECLRSCVCVVFLFHSVVLFFKLDSEWIHYQSTAGVNVWKRSYDAAVRYTACIVHVIPSVLPLTVLNVFHIL